MQECVRSPVLHYILKAISPNHFYFHFSWSFGWKTCCIEFPFNWVNAFPNGPHVRYNAWTTGLISTPELAYISSTNITNNFSSRITWLTSTFNGELNKSRGSLLFGYERLESCIKMELLYLSCAVFLYCCAKMTFSILFNLNLLPKVTKRPRFLFAKLKHVSALKPKP